MMAQVIGFLISTLEIWIEFLAPSFGLGHCGHWVSEPVDGGACCLSPSPSQRYNNGKIEKLVL